MLKLTQPHLAMNNMFPPINAHARAPSDELRGGGAAEIHSASKQQHIRRQQQNVDPQRRSPLRSNTLLPATEHKFVTAEAAAAAALAASSPSVSTSLIVRASAFVQTESSTQQIEPAKIVYRSSDYAWNDHPTTTTSAVNQPVLRAASPTKTKLATSARHLANGILHDNPTGANSMLHLPTSSSPTSPQHHQTNVESHARPRDDLNGADLLLSSAGKSRQTARLQRTSSHLDKAPTGNGYGLPLRSESYRSSRLDYGIRPRHTSSKQRSYVNSKSSFHDVVGSNDYYSGGGQDENLYYQQPQLTVASSTQRLNGSSFDLTASRKPISPNKSSSFNVAPSSGHHGFYASTQELHRSDTNIERNNLTRFGAIRGTSKDQLVAPSTAAQKYRQSITTAAAATHTPSGVQSGERHPSAQSYKSRDPNMSYAYTDVKKYIEENDLMSPEKEQLIRNWIVDVEKHRHLQQKPE